MELKIRKEIKIGKKNSTTFLIDVFVSDYGYAQTVDSWILHNGFYDEAEIQSFGYSMDGFLTYMTVWFKEETTLMAFKLEFC